MLPLEWIRVVEFGSMICVPYGAPLLDWFYHRVFVDEQRFADPAFAASQAHFFLDELAVVVHLSSDSLRPLRGIATTPRWRQPNDLRGQGDIQDPAR